MLIKGRAIDPAHFTNLPDCNPVYRFIPQKLKEAFANRISCPDHTGVCNIHTLLLKRLLPAVTVRQMSKL